MWPKLVFFVFLVLFPVAIVLGQDDKPAAPDDPNANVAAAKPADPSETTKPAESAKLAEPGETAKTSETAKIAKIAKTGETAKTAKTGETAKATEAAEAGDAEPKMVSGMSVLGNKEAPMSLFIVPWKVSELGAETSLTRTLNERPAPVDREVFRREVAFYEVSTGKADIPAGSGTP